MGNGILSGLGLGLATGGADILNTYLKMKQLDRMGEQTAVLNQLRTAQVQKLLDEQNRKDQVRGILSKISPVEEQTVSSPIDQSAIQAEVEGGGYAPSPVAQTVTRRLSLPELNNKYADAIQAHDPDLAMKLRESAEKVTREEQKEKQGLWKFMVEQAQKGGSNQQELLTKLSEVAMKTPYLRDLVPQSGLTVGEGTPMQREALELRKDIAAQNETLRRDQMAQSEQHHRENVALRQDLRGMPTQYQQNQTVGSLRKEFNQRPEVKEFNMILPKMASMEKALQESNRTGKYMATDQALITLFNKMTDPNSVVRESEYARMAINMPVVSAVKGKASKIMSGGAGLTNAERNQIVEMARLMKQAYQEAFDNTAKEYMGYAEGYGVNPKMVIGTTRMPKAGTPTPQPQSSVAKTIVKKFVSPSTGKTKYIYSDGTEEIR